MSTRARDNDNNSTSKMTPKLRLSSVVESIPHSPTLWGNDLVQEKRRAGETVHHMGFGESPFPVPPRLQQALENAASCKQYERAEGLADLRRAVSEYYRPLLGDDFVNASEVVMAPGTKLMLYALQMAVEGDLLLPVPSWVSYEPQARLLQTEIIRVPTTLDGDGYHLSEDTLRSTIQTARAQGKNPTKLILNYPNNPTGLTIPYAELEQIAAVCLELNIFVFSDEIYGLVTFDGNYRSIASLAPSHTVVTTGLSKHLGLGGWRLGLAFVPRTTLPGLFEALCCIISETWSCVAAPIQQAALEAYQRHDDVEQHIRDCTAIHRLMNVTIAQGLQNFGIVAPIPQGAFYNYVNFGAFRDALAARGIVTSRDLQRVLLQEYNLATLPGVDFGEDPTTLTLRLSGCDYDGAAALQVYRDEKVALDRAFVEHYAPRVLQGIEILGRFTADYGGRVDVE